MNDASSRATIASKVSASSLSSSRGPARAIRSCRHGSDRRADRGWRGPCGRVPAAVRLAVTGRFAVRFTTGRGGVAAQCARAGGAGACELGYADRVARSPCCSLRAPRDADAAAPLARAAVRVQGHSPASTANWAPGLREPLPAIGSGNGVGAPIFLLRSPSAEGGAPRLLCGSARHDPEQSPRWFRVLVDSEFDRMGDSDDAFVRVERSQGDQVAPSR